MNGWWHDTETWGIALGAVTPLAVAVIQQPRWPAQARWAVGWACAVIVAVVTCLANGDFDDGSTLLRTIVLTVVTAQATYAGWKRSGFVPAIEHATSPRPDGPGEPTRGGPGPVR